MNKLYCYDIGCAPYLETWNLQKSIQAEIINNKLSGRRPEVSLGREIGLGQEISQGGTEKLSSPHGVEPTPQTVLPPKEMVERNEARLSDINVRTESPSVETTEKTVPGDVLLLVEHPHVYTLGKSGDAAHLLRSDDELNALDATFVQIDRGGDITYHGPGQIVGYPIMDLDRYFTDIHKYLRFLEEVIIQTCADFGIAGERVEKLTGVWVGDAKICAFGIKCSRWVTMHGFALNVNSHLDYFGHIVPCGINDKAVCSMSSLLKRPVDEAEVKDRILFHFSRIFDVEIVNQDVDPVSLFAQHGIALASQEQTNFVK